MRDALSLTDQALAMSAGRLTAERVREALGLVPEDEYVALLDVVAERRAADVFAAVGRLAEMGIDFGLLFSGFADALRAQLAVELGGTPGDVSEHLAEALDARRGRLGSADLLRMLSIVGELEPRFKRSGQQQLLFETMLVRLALMDRTVSLEEVLRGLGGSGASVPRETPTPPRETPRPIPPVRRADEVSAARPPEPPQAALPVPAPLPALDANRLAERWDDVVARLRANGRVLLAAAVEASTPVAVSAQGVITVALDEPDEIRVQALESGKAEILDAIRNLFSGVERLVVRVPSVAPSAPPKRMTDESVRADRVASLTKKDPVLGAAIEALDLELLD